VASICKIERARSESFEFGRVTTSRHVVFSALLFVVVVVFNISVWTRCDR